MKKKTLILIIEIVVVVAALAIVGILLATRSSGETSRQASMFARQLNKDTYTTEDAFNEYLEEKETENAEPYVLPDTVAFSVDVEEQSFEDMQYFIMNSGASDTVIVYFPGGSFIDQPREVHWQFLDSLCSDSGAEVIVPIYPKLPTANASSTYALLMDFYAEVAQDCSQLIFMGDSAGGGMALSLAMQLRDEGTEGPDQLILICPWVDVTMEDPDIPEYEEDDPALDSAMLAHLGALWADDLSTTDPVVSPLYGTFEGLGYITLFTSTGELLYPDIMLLDSALTAAGIDHTTITATGMFHVWPLYIHYSIPETKETYQQIIDIVAGA